MTTMLAFCGCGHTDQEHKPGRGCTHLNRPSRDHPTSARCHCGRLRPDPRLADVEEFLVKVLNALERNEGTPRLEPVERDELIQVMRISLWAASTKYDSRSHIRFGSFAAIEVYNDAVDEMRSSRMFGRRGQYRVPQQRRVAADEDLSILDQVDPLDHGDAGQGRLERVVAELTVDPPDVGPVAVRWALTDRDREALGAAATGRRATAAGAPQRARAAAWARGLEALIDTQPKEVAA